MKNNEEKINIIEKEKENKETRMNLVIKDNDVANKLNELSKETGKNKTQIINEILSNTLLNKVNEKIKTIKDNDGEIDSNEILDSINEIKNTLSTDEFKAFISCFYNFNNSFHFLCNQIMQDDEIKSFKENVKNHFVDILYDIDDYNKDLLIELKKTSNDVSEVCRSINDHFVEVVCEKKIEESIRIKKEELDEIENKVNKKGKERVVYKTLSIVFGITSIILLGFVILLLLNVTNII